MKGILKAFRSVVSYRDPPKSPLKRGNNKYLLPVSATTTVSGFNTLKRETKKQIFSPLQKGGLGGISKYFIVTDRNYFSSKLINAA